MKSVMRDNFTCIHAYIITVCGGDDLLVYMHIYDYSVWRDNFTCIHAYIITVCGGITYLYTCIYYYSVCGDNLLVYMHMNSADTGMVCHLYASFYVSS